jgi:poly(3-hydroxybutyrate) depolymerase
MNYQVMLTRIALLSALLCSALWSCQNAGAQDQRARDLERLRKELPPVAYFDKWLNRTGEVLPDLDSLPFYPNAQPLLTVTQDKQQHRVTAEEWPARRAVLRELVERWILGKAPPAPDNVRVVIESKSSEPTHEVWTVRLEFGPDHAARLPCWLWVPHQPKVSRLPVYLSDAPRTARFGMPALEAGELAICIYAANDGADASRAYKDLFGNYDWEDLRRRGWSASRAVDWLTTLNFVDPRQIYIGGHSRSAKASLAATAFDDRIAGVIASSPGGGGGSMNFCFSDQYYLYASAEGLTRGFPTWRTPRLRLFTGLENQLPADNHMIYALVAPRPLLMSTALHDPVENTWGIERVFEQVREVYELLGRPENIGLRYRPGPHAPDAGAYAAHNEFLLRAIEGQSIAETFPYRPYHPWHYEAWAAKQPPLKSPAKAAANVSREQITERIQWLLGDAPALTSPQAEIRMSTRPESPAKVVFENGFSADVYYPPAAQRPEGRKLPAVLWLGSFNTSAGYKNGPGSPGAPAQDVFPRAGLVMLAYDPIGARNRHEERRVFYDRHPNWSLMGKMVQDARIALGGLASCPDVDPDRIFVVGYGMGGMVTSFLMALDDRPAGAAIIAGFTPFRSDTDVRGTGGVRRWSHLYGWIQRLGPFVGREQEIPIDFDQILVAAAPRPMLIMAPTRDWHTTHADVVAAVSSAQQEYARRGGAGQLTLESPDRWLEYNRAMQAQTVDWLHSQAGVNLEGRP